MKKLIDLHVHSSYSDGDYTPTELIHIAKSKNIGTISITDHDTVLAYHNMEAQNDVEVIPGIELSAKDEIGRMHILGYGINPFDSKLTKKIEQLKENNIDAFFMILDCLKKHGLIFDSKDISCLLNKNGDVGRNDLAKLCVDYGYSETVDDAFKKYLIDAHLKTRSKRKEMSYEECCDVIREAGGIPVLAHPVTLNRSVQELDSFVEKLVMAGLMGIEVIHSKHTSEEITFYIELINKYNLLFSGGTDYHGEITKPEIEIGVGKQKKLILTNCSVLDYVKGRR